MIPLTRECLKTAGLTLADLDAIAYTQGPGLGGALLVGAAVANGLAFGLNLPVIPVHHLEGHLLSPMLADPAPTFPFVALLVSGGHQCGFGLAGQGGGGFARGGPAGDLHAGVFAVWHGALGVSDAAPADLLVHDARQRGGAGRYVGVAAATHQGLQGGEDVGFGGHFFSACLMRSIIVFFTAPFARP